MKKFILIITAVVSLMTFSSCAGMLDEVNYGNPTIEEVMSNPDNAVLLVGQAYADIKWLHDHWGYWGVASLTSDECVNPVRNPGNHWADGGYWNSLNNHTWTSKADSFKNIWNTTISGAVGCNKTLSTLKSYEKAIAPDVYAAYTCELETLRSYYFYLLFDCFGRIPYIEEFKTETKPLVEPEEVWARLVNVLERNVLSLPEVSDATRAQYYGRVTKGFGYALLARLYLNAESFGCTPEEVNVYLDEANKVSSATDFYTKAAACCDKIIESGAYSIEDDFFTNFKILNENSRENIFVIVEDGSSKDARSNGSMSDKLRVGMLTGHYCMQDTWSLVEKPWNGFCARPTVLDRYDSSDVRGPGDEGKGTDNLKQWGWFVGPIYDSEGNPAKDENGLVANVTNTIASLGDATWNDGARLLKYEYDKTGTYQYCENDFVLFRYADVLWMYEEAVVRGAAGYSTKRNSDDFKTMLGRAFAYSAEDRDAQVAAFYEAYPEDELFTVKGILDERGREFAWENVRRRDLIRCGKFGDPGYVQYVTASDKYREWFPIPYSVLEKAVRDKNGQPIWTQNEGYND